MKQIWSMTKIEFYKIIRGHIPIYILAFYSFLLLIHMQDKTWEEFLKNTFFMYSTVIGLMGFGILSSWVFGREYQDQTFKDLLSLPISRTSLVYSKFFALGLCFLGITVLAIGATFAIGLSLDLTNFDVLLTGTLLKRLGIVTLYNCSLSFLFPLIASMTRGILAPVSTSFVAIIIAAIFGSQPLGRYIPWTISGIYLNNPQLINWISKLTILVILFIGVYGTILWWNYVDQK
ncbi:ABC transporter permease [Clostridium sp. BL-8]|uniref:ABC transporter permease n=1 Tax=Clostridium sp. BL-8 TaxID=349938 RepID=UPI00098C855E|nr:ABC transporter permease [Clostridium sp. BL-8]OOM81155.1 ABC-2 family transporter protein [Clostridium sp. BL-8]